MSLNGQDPYALLGISADSSIDEVRERYLILVQVWHPDKHGSSPAKVRAQAVREMQQINLAYEYIMAGGERETREREARERAAREARERAAREAREREAREARERAAREARERAAREARERAAREAREREAREARERAAREARAREARERAAREGHLRQESHDLSQESPARALHDEVSAFHAIAIVLPSGIEGFTVRAYPDKDQDEAAFLGAQNRLLLFPSVGLLLDYLSGHDVHALVDVPGWDNFKYKTLVTPVEIPDDRRFELDLVQHSLKFPPARWIPSLFTDARNLIWEIANQFELHRALKLIASGSALDELDDLLRLTDRAIAGRAARRQLSTLNVRPAIMAWKKVLRDVEDNVHWPS